MNYQELEERFNGYLHEGFRSAFIKVVNDIEEQCWIDQRTPNADENRWVDEKTIDIRKS